uniref:Uncharacterized protein n=1 Tax=Anguilla anguilla TaxID=7936 RepID=A0A0E9RW34_ANGAN
MGSFFPSACTLSSFAWVCRIPSCHVTSLSKYLAGMQKKQKKTTGTERKTVFLRPAR